MLPEPVAVNPLAPPVCVAVYVAPVKIAGNVSPTVAPTATLGPKLVTTIVYVSLVPGIAVVLPSVLLISRSVCGPSVSMSVAVHVPLAPVKLIGLSVVPGDAVVQCVPTLLLNATVALLVSVPVAVALMVPITMYLMVLPTGIVTVSAMLPAPLAVKPVAPPV